MLFKIYTDGGARGNPGPAASSFIIYKQDGSSIGQSKYLGVATNNVAEYHGVILALEWISTQEIGKNQTTLHFFLDSNLVVSQLNKEFKIKNEELKKLASSVFEQLGQYKLVSFTHIPREQNSEADLLVNRCLDENS